MLAYEFPRVTPILARRSSAACGGLDGFLACVLIARSREWHIISISDVTFPGGSTHASTEQFSKEKELFFFPATLLRRSLSLPLSHTYDQLAGKKNCQKLGEIFNRRLQGDVIRLWAPQTGQSDPQGLRHLGLGTKLVRTSLVAISTLPAKLWECYQGIAITADQEPHWKWMIFSPHLKCRAGYSDRNLYKFKQLWA